MTRKAAQSVPTGAVSSPTAKPESSGNEGLACLHQTVDPQIYQHYLGIVRASLGIFCAATGSSASRQRSLDIKTFSLPTLPPVQSLFAS